MEGMASGGWTRIGRPGLQARGSLREPPSELEEGDECYFLHAYRVGAEPDPGGGTSLIRDFKIGAGTSGYPARKRWKEEACRRFAQDLAEILSHGRSVSCVPTSRRRDDPAYDPRFEMLADCLGACREDLVFESQLAVAQSRPPAHEGGPRQPERIRRSLAWTGLRRSTDSIALVDDVITTGASFKACQAMFAEHGVGVVGYFWGMSVPALRSWPPYSRQGFGMNLGLRLVLLAIVASLGAGCSTLQVSRLDAGVAKKDRRVFVERRLADGRGIDRLIADELGRLGYTASSGARTMMPLDTDLLVSYDDQWIWDFNTYLIQLDVTARNARTDKVVGGGRCNRPSMAFGAPAQKLVHDLLARVFPPQAP
jgi:hypothetical protein